MEDETNTKTNEQQLVTVAHMEQMFQYLKQLNTQTKPNTTSSSGFHPSEIGKGLIIKNRSEITSFRREEDRTHLRCSHCGGTKHTKEGCFKLIGYPKWWEEHKHRRAATKGTTNRTGGKAHLASVLPDRRQTPTTQHRSDPHQSDSGKTKNQWEKAIGVNGGNERTETLLEKMREAGPNTPFYNGSNYDSKGYYDNPMDPKPKTNLNCHGKFVGLVCDKQNKSWIFDCGATDTMTYDVNDLRGIIDSSRSKFRPQMVISLMLLMQAQLIYLHL